MSRYRYVSAMKADGFPTRAACRAAEVSPSAYYAWLERSSAPTEAEWDEALLVNEMVGIHAESDATYGSPRMTPELRRHGFCANHKRVERLMREHGIVGVAPRRSVRTTIRDDLAPPLPDLIGQDFSPGAPNERYCGDITYVPTGEGWLYLATVLDLGSRRPRAQQPAPQDPRLEDPGRGLQRTPTLAPTARCCIDRWSLPCPPDVSTVTDG